MNLEPIFGLNTAAQLEWMQSLRARTATIELVFHDGDADSKLAEKLKHLNPTREIGVGKLPGYEKPAPHAVLHRYAYDRGILEAIEELGGLFENTSTKQGDNTEFTQLGNVDVTFRDEHGNVLGATVTHEGLILRPRE